MSLIYIKKIITTLGFLTIFSWAFSALAGTQFYKTSYDCSKASSEIEKTICGVKALADADTELGLLYKKLLSQLPETDGAILKKEQIEWLAIRNTSCVNQKANSACIQDLYVKRVAALKNRQSGRRGEWKVWSADGKGVSYSFRTLKKQNSITDNIENNVLALHYDIKWIKQQKENKGEKFKLDLQVLPIGRWWDFEVYDVYDTDFQTKQIVIKAGEADYRIIYSLWPISGKIDDFPPPPTEIRKIDGRDVLISKVHVWRSEHYEHYIIYDAHADAPVIRDLVESIQLRVKEKLEGKYNVFCEDDIDKLTFSCGLWDIKDPHRSEEGFKGHLTGKIGFGTDDIVLNDMTVDM